MEVYVLDEWLRRVEVIDQFESCVWTDRFALSGDIDLVVDGNQNYRRILTEGVILACNESDRIMQIVTVERNQDDSDRKLIKVKGVSAEEFYLNNRIALRSNLPLGDKPNWNYIGKPAWIMRELFKTQCVWGILNQYDTLPFYVDGNTYPADTIAEPPTDATYEVEPGMVYDALAEICSSYDLGFRIVRNQDWSELRFNVYAGNDRTTRQTGFPAVVFSANMDNLSDINEFESSADYKNCAYVMHKNANMVTVYTTNVDPTIAGFERRTLLVDGNSIDSALTGTALTNAMIALGKQELAKHARLAAFDGVVSQYNNYKPGRDYLLGDLVEIQSETGANSVMRVTEIIYASDAQGDRAYPTLSINKYINPGSWLSWDYSQTWEQATATWAEA